MRVLQEEISQLKNLVEESLQDNQVEESLQDNQIKALQAEIFRLEGVRRALARDNQVIDKISVSYRRSPPDLFPDNPYWTALSSWLREEKNWTCEKCGINLENRKYDLHVHHVLGRGFNSPQHLKVLCIACHAEEPDHAFMKAYPEYKAFLEWKKRQMA